MARHLQSKLTWLRSTYYLLFLCPVSDNEAVSITHKMQDFYSPEMELLFTINLN